MVHLEDEEMRIKTVSVVFKILFLLVLFAFITPSLFSGSFWEGSITTANYGVLPEDGF